MVYSKGGSVRDCQFAYVPSDRKLLRNHKSLFFYVFSLFSQLNFAFFKLRKSKAIDWYQNESKFMLIYAIFVNFSDCDQKVFDFLISRFKEVIFGCKLLIIVALELWMHKEVLETKNNKENNLVHLLSPEPSIFGHFFTFYFSFCFQSDKKLIISWRIRKQTLERRWSESFRILAEKGSHLPKISNLAWFLLRFGVIRLLLTSGVWKKQN